MSILPETVLSDLPKLTLKEKLTIALVGNPNCGKTTLFNALTGLNQKVGNFPGVTVDRKVGKALVGGREIFLVDLPGTYSLYPKSIDETVTKKILCDGDDPDHPDAVLLVVDASNLKRSLLLCTQVIDLGIPCILVLNMMDLARKQNLAIDVAHLSEKLGVKVVEMNAREDEGLVDLKKILFHPIEKPKVQVFNPDYFAPGIIEDIKSFSNPDGSFYSQLHLACDPSYCKGRRRKSPKEPDVVSELFSKHNIDEKKLQSDEMVYRYTFISNVLKESVSKIPAAPRNDFSSKVDKILVHKVYGFVFFMLVLFVIFQTIYNLSAYPMEFIEWGFVELSIAVSNWLPEGILSSLLVDGVLAGLSGILIFIPQIAFLFAFIAILEDTGYMSRVSFIMDKLMRKIGLNGKSVIPLLSGTACAVPAIMSTRTIGNWKERLITLMVIPLISCSARIPVYTLIIALVVPNEFLLGLFNWQGIALMILYLLGFVAAIGSAWLLKKILKTSERSHFIMEMPVYRAPRWSSVGYTILEKVKAFVFEAGKVILAISIVLWFLSSFGPGNEFEKIDEKWAVADVEADVAAEKIAAEKLEASYAGKFGKSIEPAIKPLGFDWKIGIALLTSFAAREVFVGTMATIYSVGDPDNTSSIRKKMMDERDSITGEKRYTRATGISLMVFFAFALQCMSTLAVTYRETKHWKWPLAQFLFMGALAYVSSLIAYNIF